VSPRTAIVVGLLAAFLFGTTAGLVGGFVLARSGGPGFPPFGGARHGMERFQRGGPMRPPRAVIAMVERELKLTPGQSAKFREVLERQRSRMDAVHDSLRAEMERVLTPEQRERWKRLDERWRREGPGPHGTRGGRDHEGPPPGAPMGMPLEPPPDDSGR